MFLGFCVQVWQSDTMLEPFFPWRNEPSCAQVMCRNLLEPASRCILSVKLHTCKNYVSRVLCGGMENLGVRCWRSALPSSCLVLSSLCSSSPWTDISPWCIKGNANLIGFQYSNGSRENYCHWRGVFPKPSRATSGFKWWKILRESTSPSDFNPPEVDWEKDRNGFHWKQHGWCVHGRFHQSALM